MSGPGAVGTARPATRRSGEPTARSVGLRRWDPARKAVPRPEAPRPTARPVRTALSSLQNLSKLAYLWQIRRGWTFRLARGNAFLRELLEAGNRGADEVVGGRRARGQTHGDRAALRHPPPRP